MENASPMPPPPPQTEQPASTTAAAELSAAVSQLLGYCRSGAVARGTQVLGGLRRMQGLGPRSIFDEAPDDLKTKVLELSRSRDLPTSTRVLIERAAGSLVGLAVADGLGHYFEFLPACDEPGGPDGRGPRLFYPAADPARSPAGEVQQPYNRFQLQPGQWTDDASMSLCLADSLLLRGGYDGSHLRAFARLHASAHLGALPCMQV